VSRDGATFTFAPGDPTISALTPGKILLVWGIALRKVTAVESQAAGTVVRTDVVSLPEALPEGHIAWSGHTALGQGIVTPAAAPGDTVSKRTSLGPVPGAGLFRFASWQGEDHPEDGEAKQGEDNEGDAAEEAELPHHSDGEYGASRPTSPTPAARRP
jgi:hypothetical protein